MERLQRAAYSTASSSFQRIHDSVIMARRPSAGGRCSRTIAGIASRTGRAHTTSPRMSRSALSHPHVSIARWPIRRARALPCIAAAAASTRAVDSLVEEFVTRRIEDFDERISAGGGPGGQKINRTRNCVTLTHRPTGTWCACACT